MSTLVIYAEDCPQHGERFSDFEAIQAQLNDIGVRFERWIANHEFAADADSDTILAAYADTIDKLREEYGFQSIDLINLTPEQPEKDTLRKRFLAEHTHDDFEIRFFVDGHGLFYLHVNKKVYAVLCKKGDLISVPANTTHWFDMGEHPYFKAIRFFTTPYGWVANFTGNPVADAFPTLDEFIMQLI